MREIKFRAWEKQSKEIIPVYNIDFQYKIINRGSAWRFFHEIELMQSTELKDKKGVEIYEKDLILTEDGKKFTVIFKDGCFGILEKKRKSFHSDEMYDHFYTLNQIDVYNCEVLGNVYEKKELMEDK